MTTVTAAGLLTWHDLECGGYAADLALWRELAAVADGPVLDVTAGAGRVTLDLTRAGHEVTAVDLEDELLAALRARAAEEGLPVHTARADARELALARRDFALCLVPMQGVQLLGGAAGRAAFLRQARTHLRPGAVLAAALAGPLEPFDGAHAPAPLPDLRERDGFLYASQPVAVRAQRRTWTIERLRQVVAPDGARTAEADVVRLDRLAPDQLEREAAALGFQARPRRAIDATPEHVGSEVVVLRR